MIYVRFKPDDATPAKLYRVEEDKADSADIANRARARIFPDQQIPESDPVFERILKAMKKDGICG